VPDKPRVATGLVGAGGGSFPDPRPRRSLINRRGLRGPMTKYRVTYKMESPADVADIVFVVYKEMSRYTKQDPFDWFMEGKAEWAGKKVLSVEMVD
jgi:hypothetical protein